MDFAQISWHLIHGLLYCVLGSALTATIVFVVYLQSRQELAIWHQDILKSEYTTKSKVQNFKQYLELEKTLFQEVDKKINQKLSSNQKTKLNRFYHNSLSSPDNWPQNWNKSFEFTRPEPKAGVLLLHGLSDSPYSLHTIGQTLHRYQANVIGLRLPGHGTAPSGLLKVQWEDMASAVKLAILHLKNSIGDKPIYIIGYSNGGALALNYALNTINDSNLPKIKNIVLISPEIGVAKLARFAFVQEKLGHLLGLEKLAWNSIRAEYDTYKYNSFALNAAIQANRITSQLQKELNKHINQKTIDQLPPIMTFQSAVDNTVSTEAVVQNLYNKLSGSQHELIIFDINRYNNMNMLINFMSQEKMLNLVENQENNYKTTIITNTSTKSSEVHARFYQHKTSKWMNQELALYWPTNLYSLSHVALPFAKNDTLYGATDNEYGLQLGTLALYGERGILQIPPGDILRLRWNPFYSYMEQNILSFLDLTY